MPIGGVLLNDKVKDVFGPGDHGTTFGGNPVACAGANVVLSHMNQELFDEVKRKGEYIKKRALQMPHVIGVNGLGLMRGIVLDGISAIDVVRACIDSGLLLLTAKDKVRMLPPLIITDEQLEKACDILEEVLKAW